MDDSRPYPGKPRPHVWIATLATLCATTACADTAGPPTTAESTLRSAIDSIFDAALTEGPVAGAAVAVLRGLEPLHVGYYGLANDDPSTPVDSTTLFNIASVTKPFTGAALVTLHEAGRLDLDDRLLDWIPEFPNPDQGRRIRLAQLVDHTSGLDDYVAADLERWVATNEPFSAAFLMDYLRDRPLDFEPGEHWSYTNSGFYLAGMVIERASGLPWFDYLRTTFLEPAGLDDIQLCDDAGERRTVGFRADSVLEPSPLYLEGGVRGDGGICASALHLARFGSTIDDRVGSDVLARMRTPTVLTTGAEVDYGAALRLGVLQGHTVFGHTGGSSGYVGVLARFPDDDVTVATLVNTARTDADALTLMGEVIVRVLDLDAGMPAEVAITDEALAPYTGRYRGGRDETFFDVRAEGGRLRISPAEGGASTEFIHLGDHTFAMADGAYPLDRYRFQIVDGVARAYSGYYNGMHQVFRQRVDRP